MNDMVFNKFCAFCCPVNGVFYTTFPFHYCPSFKIILCQFAENRFKINLSIAQRAETASPVNPALVATINTLLPGWIKLCIFYMKHADAFMIIIYIFQVIQALQHKM